MKYVATWTEERTDVLEAPNTKAAESIVMAAIRRSPDPSRVKLLSITLAEDEPPPPAPQEPLASAA